MANPNSSVNSISAVVLTISDSAAQGERVDESGPAIVALLEASNITVTDTAIVPDEREMIADRLRHFADSGTVNLIVTTGGTGLAQRDVTPEATLEVIDREAPGPV